MNRSEKLVKNTAILAFGTLCTKVLTFIMVPLFSSWLTTEEYGDFDLLCTYITLAIPLITLSCGEAVFRKLLDEKDEIRRKSIVSTCLAIVLVGLTVLTLAIVFVFSKYYPNAVVSFLALAIAETVNNFLQYYVRGKKRLSVYSIGSISFVISMSAFVTIFVLLFDMGLQGILWGYTAGYCTSSVIFILTTKMWKDFKPRTVSASTFKEVISYSAPLIPNSVSWWIANASDRTIINIVLGSAANGIYAIANKIPSICTALFSVFHLSWQETASDSINDSDREIYYCRVYNKTTKMILSICSVVLSVNIVLFDVILDPRYITAQYHVPILMSAIVFSFLAQFIGGIFIGFQNTKVNGLTTVIAAISNIIIHLCLINFIGLYAASISTLSSYIVLYIIRIIMIRKYVKLKMDKRAYLNWAIYMLVLVAQFTNIAAIKIVFIPIAIYYFIASNRMLIMGLTKKLLKR